MPLHANYLPLLLIDNVQLAAELWPDDENATGHDDSPDEDLSLEDQISKEVAAMKRPRDERLFSM